MIESIAEHSLETSLLYPGCAVLDVGCNGFEFGNHLRSLFNARVYEVDINHLNSDQPYYHCGIAAANGRGAASLEFDSEARSLIVGNRFQVYTIESFSDLVGVNHWDAIKLDCEGSEYDILWNLESPPATQISVEFHQHTAARRGGKYMAKLLKRLRRWYDVRQHELGGSEYSRNYWDSLFVLK